MNSAYIYAKIKRLEQSEFNTTHILRELPNGTKDELIINDGKYVKLAKVSEPYKLKASDFGTMLTAFAGWDGIYLKTLDNQDTTLKSNNGIGKVLIFTATEYFYDNRARIVASGLGWFIGPNGEIILCFEKDKYANIEAAIADLTSLELLYQLATPINIPLPEMSENTKRIFDLENNQDTKTDTIVGITPNREEWYTEIVPILTAKSELNTFGDNVCPNLELKYLGYGGLLFPSVGNIQRLETSINIDLSTYSYIEILFHINKLVDVSHIRCIFYSGSNYATISAHTKAKQILLDGFRRLLFRRSNASYSAGFTDASWGNITSCRLQLTAAAGQAVDLNVFAVNAIVAKPAITIEFDDGYSSVYEKAYPVMRKLGLAGNANINTSSIELENKMTWAQLRELHNQGWSINNHTHGHINLSTSTEQEIRDDLSKSRRILKTQGFHDGANYLVCPYGTIDVSKYPIYFDYCKHIRVESVAGLNVQPLPNIFLESSRGYMKTSYTGISSSVTVETAKGYIDEIIAEGVHANLNWHKIVDGVPEGGTEYNINDFIEIMEYIAAKRDAGELIVLTARDLMYQYRGYLTEDADGHAYLNSTKEGKPIIIDLEIDLEE